MHSLVTTQWLADAIDAPDLRIADATLLDPALGRDAMAEFRAGHIPGAVFLRLADLREIASPLPNTLPSAVTMAERLGELGLGSANRIVLYDNSPWHSAARAWWLLSSYGVGQVAILDGGIARWREEGRTVETGDTVPHRSAIVPTFAPTRHRTSTQMRDILASGAEQVVDARSAARFTGEESDPHGAAPGHMPGAINLPYPRLFNPDGTWKRGDDLRAAFTDSGVDLERPITATCGSGITAAVLAFGAHLLGRDAALYDGSWAEWGSDPATPKVLGA